MVLKVNRMTVPEVLTPLAVVEESTIREVVRAPVKAMLEVGAPLTTTIMVTETTMMTVIVAEAGRVPVVTVLLLGAPIAVRTVVLRQNMKMMDEMHVETASVPAHSMVTLHSRHSGRSFRTVSPTTGGSPMTSWRS